MSIDKEEIALASYVALRVDGWDISQGCVAWVDSRDSTCAKPPSGYSMLCKRHRNVAAKRHEKRKEEVLKQQAERAEYRSRMLPEWKAELAKVEALMERYGSAPTTDRAAYGGETHPSIQKAQLRQLSDTNVQRMAKLARRAERLREQIGND
jgi:hypothetical protein